MKQYRTVNTQLSLPLQIWTAHLCTACSFQLWVALCNITSFHCLNSSTICCFEATEVLKCAQFGSLWKLTCLAQKSPPHEAANWRNWLGYNGTATSPVLWMKPHTGASVTILPHHFQEIIDLMHLLDAEFSQCRKCYLPVPQVRH